MLKKAYELGVRQALEDAGLVKQAELTPHEKANRLPLELLGGTGGTLIGGVGGSMLGGLGGLGLAKALDLDERMSIGIGGILGGLTGAGLGGYGGYRSGKNLANEAVRRSMVGDVFHAAGYGPGMYDSTGTKAQEVRRYLIDQGILSG